MAEHWKVDMHTEEQELLYKLLRKMLNDDDKPVLPSQLVQSLRPKSNRPPAPPLTPGRREESVLQPQVRFGISSRVGSSSLPVFGWADACDFEKEHPIISESRNEASGKYGVSHI